MIRKITTLYAFINIIFVGAQPQVEYKNIAENRAEVTVLFTLSSNDYLYHDYFSVSANSPDIAIDDWKVTTKPIDQFDPDFKETKKIYAHNPKLIIHLTYLKPTVTQLSIRYYQKSRKNIESLSIPISSTNPHTDTIVDTDFPDSQASDTMTLSPRDTMVQESHNWSDTISDVLKKTHSLWVRLFFALILGLLLSLTPCIYPMIPITVGILQSRGTKSIIRNFLLAATYVVGIATTFALLGLAAAFTGQIFGSLLSKPLFVWSLVLFLVYLALSMIGLYDMYIPSFLQPRAQQYQGGSLISIFLFGAISGTIASPCLSPGLFLLLTLVTTLGSKLIGFLLLFSFGIGLGVPLLIIGTFSGSLNVLPSAGIWMVEIKKFFGFIMIGMCFFYLKNIMAFSTLLWAIGITLFMSGIFYFHAAKTVPGWKKLYNILGTLLIITSMVTIFKAFQTLYPITAKEQGDSIQWITDCDTAFAQAQQENKKLFVDVTAPYCSICKAIDKKILQNEEVIHAMKEFVCIKIDNKEANKQHEALQKQWLVTGVPAFLIIDSTENTIIKRLGAEVYDLSPQHFINIIKKYS